MKKCEYLGNRPKRVEEAMSRRGAAVELTVGRCLAGSWE